ncbi:MAG TPA: helix-turn-helix domain-containing protein [Actinomycetes bacterium]
MSGDDFDASVTGVATLAEPVRRALYRWVSAQPGPVNRDQAAEGVGVPRHVAKFHLDKLEDEGLLEVEFRRPAGRAGPGAGRPAKLYRRSRRELAVTVPERRYELASRVLAQAITAARRDGVPIGEALRAAATHEGRQHGAAARPLPGANADRDAHPAAALQVLADHGYEPRDDGQGGLLLGNCPFHALAKDSTELVCGMNLDLIGGLLDGLNEAKLEARLDPAPGRCCVVVRPRSTRKESP